MATRGSRKTHLLRKLVYCVVGCLHDGEYNLDITHYRHAVNSQKVHYKHNISLSLAYVLMQRQTDKCGNFSNTVDNLLGQNARVACAFCYIR